MALLANMHPSLRALIGDALERDVDRHSINRPLPLSFSPAHILVKFMERAAYVHRPGLMSTTPRDLNSKPIAIHRALASNKPPLEKLVAAIAQSAPEGPCCFCKGKHPVSKCPDFKSEILANRGARSALQGLLRDKPANDKNQKRSSPNRKQILQILSDLAGSKEDDQDDQEDKDDDDGASSNDEKSDQDADDAASDF
jgi:hypothetical protein